MKINDLLHRAYIVLAVAALVCGWAVVPAFAAVSIPTCNSFDTNGNPIYSSSGYPDTNGTTNCTDYFGVPNWANSPLPAGQIADFTIVSGGDGYVNPQIVISDPTGTGAQATATVHDGAITGINLVSGGSGYILPRVTIIDSTGSGAMATALIGPPYSGGMLKFQDPLKDLKTTIATPNTSKFPGSDYYEIALVQYTQKMHSSLPPTTLRGYVQVNPGSTNAGSCLSQNWTNPPSYLGPVIVAQMNRPVRVKFTNCLPPGPAGVLSIPTDTTYMGAGMGPDGNTYTENRAVVHLHGGATPWISDGTPHQWTAPVGESSTTLLKGDSVSYVPDMFFDANGVVQPPIPQCSKTVTANCYPNSVPGSLSNNPGDGALTYFWTNQQGGRLLFYHDHAYGITRLNVYAGEAAGYLIVDPLQEDILAAGTAPGTVGSSPDLAHLIPLVIQDKTFVASSAQMAATDPTWAANFGTTPGTANLGDLWMNHVYMPNQNPNDPTMASGEGHWDYGPWFFPPQTSLTAATPSPTDITIPCTSAWAPGELLAPTPACPACGCPIIPNPSGTPESFMDTPVVNGVAYPVLHVAPEAYRFQILSVGNDRSFNLSWFVADPNQQTEVAMLPADPHSANSTLPLCSIINSVAVPPLSIGLATGLLDAGGNPLNGTGLPANCWPNYGPQQGIPVIQSMWSADGRIGGVPDPRTAGPAWIQIGSEGGLLPAPVVIPATPTNYEFNTRSITIGSVGVHGLWVGPAERADVIVDFSKFAGKTLILYNDAPAPAPASDSRLDYFTDDGDQTPIGGAPTTVPGYGPNTRTIMQVVIDQPATATVPFSLPLLKQAFNSTATSDGVFALTQPTTIVPQAGYSGAYNQPMTDTFFGIQSETLTFSPLAPQNLDRPCTATPPAICGTLDRKTIQELFTADYGRMNATLGVELPLTNFLTQTTIPYGYIDPPTEIMREGDTQLWRITHNGVDSHFIHFHLFNVQVVNRVGWDGSLRPPDANELGWKDTVRMNPLEDILVAIQPITPVLPFPIPDSVRNMDVTLPAGVTSPGFTNVDPNNNPVTPPMLNAPINFGWEYVWHCHILGHEENDMMRPIVFQAAPYVPGDLLATGSTGSVTLTWTDKSASEDSYTVQRDIDPSFSTLSLATFTVDGGSITGFSKLGFGQTVTLVDSAGTGTFYYRVQANDSFTPTATAYPVDFQTQPMSSAWSNVASNGPVAYASVAPAALDLGNQAVPTTSAAMTVTVTNTGNATMSGISTSVTGSNPGSFSVNNGCSSLSAGSSCLVTVTFTPSTIGFATAVLTISSSAINTAPTVQLIGLGIAPIASLLTTSLTFTNQPLNTLSTAQTFTVANTGNELMTGITFATTGGNAAGDFLLAHDCGTTLAAGSFCTVSVTFKPTAVGARSTTVRVTGSASNLPISVNVSGTGITQATANLSRTLIPFADVLLTTISSAQTVTITNSGSATLVSTITVTGANAGDFNLQTNGCSSVAISANCAMTVTFAPGAMGPRTASISIATNDPVNPLITVTLTGNGIAPVANIATPAIAFGNVVVNTTSAAQTILITNPGTAPLVINTMGITGLNAAEFAISGTTCGTLPAILGLRGTCTVSITFSPASGGMKSASFNINTSDPITPNVSSALSGLGTLTGVSTTAVTFGSQLVGTTSAGQVVSLINSGSTAIKMTSVASGITITGPDAVDFKRTTSCTATLGAGKSCTITVKFAPKTAGMRTATLSIVNNDPASPMTVDLTGTAVAPINSLDQLSFVFSAPLNVMTASQTVTITNTGTAPLKITGIGLGGRNPGQFARTTTCGTFPAILAPGASCTASVTFKATATSPSTKLATLNVNVAAPAVKQTVTLIGTVDGVAVNTVSPLSMPFGAQAIGTSSAAQTLTVTNTGPVDLKLNSITLGGTNPGQFTWTSTSCVPFPKILSSGDSCTVDVIFRPTTKGNKIATINVNAAAPAGTRPVSLTGTGQ